MLKSGSSELSLAGGNSTPLSPEVKVCSPLKFTHHSKC